MTQCTVVLRPLSVRIGWTSRTQTPSPGCVSPVQTHLCACPTSHISVRVAVAGGCAAQMSQQTIPPSTMPARQPFRAAAALPDPRSVHPPGIAVQPHVCGDPRCLQEGESDHFEFPRHNIQHPPNVPVASTTHARKPPTTFGSQAPPRELKSRKHLQLWAGDGAVPGPGPHRLPRPAAQSSLGCDDTTLAPSGSTRDESLPRTPRLSRIFWADPWPYASACGGRYGGR